MNSYDRAPERGEIYYITRTPTIGSEQQAGRPAIIISNDKNNVYGNTVEVVYLTTQPKTDLPTHVTIRSTQRQSTALCEQIWTIDTSRVTDYVGTCTAQEMSAIDAALMISLGIQAPEAKGKVVEVVKEVEVIKEVPVEVIKEVPTGDPTEAIVLKAQLTALQAMYDSLLERMMPTKRGKKKEVE